MELVNRLLSEGWTEIRLTRNSSLFVKDKTKCLVIFNRGVAKII
jgi:hypothetical protein